MRSLPPEKRMGEVGIKNVENRKHEEYKERKDHRWERRTLKPSWTNLYQNLKHCDKFRWKKFIYTFHYKIFVQNLLLLPNKNW